MTSAVFRNGWDSAGGRTSETVSIMYTVVLKYTTSTTDKLLGFAGLSL